MAKASEVVQGFRTRIRAAKLVQTFANLVQGMILGELRDATLDKTFRKVLQDEFSALVDGKREWDVAESTLGRWANAGTTATVLGYTLSTAADGSESFDIPAKFDGKEAPTVKALAELYTLIERGRKAGDADIRGAWFDKAREAWDRALNRKQGTLDQRVRKEVDRVLGRKPKTPKDGDGDGGNGGNEDAGNDGEVGSGADLGATEDATVRMVDLAKVRTLIVDVERQIEVSAKEYKVSRAKVTAIWSDALRFANEHGSQNVAACIASDVHEVLAAATATEDENENENDENDENENDS